MKTICKKSSGELQDVLTVTNSMSSLNLIKLAIPMFFEVIFNFLIGTVSTIVLSGYSMLSAKYSLVNHIHCYDYQNNCLLLRLLDGDITRNL